MSDNTEPAQSNGTKPPSGRRKRRLVSPLMVRAPEAARLCGTSEASWWRWVAGHLCPAGVRVAGQRLWSRRSLALWVRWGCPSRAEFEARLAVEHRADARPRY
jgi:hypothetical protein